MVRVSVLGPVVSDISEGVTVRYLVGIRRIGRINRNRPDLGAIGFLYLFLFVSFMRDLNYSAQELSGSSKMGPFKTWVWERVKDRVVRPWAGSALPRRARADRSKGRDERGEEIRAGYDRAHACDGRVRV